MFAWNHDKPEQHLHSTCTFNYRAPSLSTRVTTLLLTKKSRTFPGLSRTPWKIFQDLFRDRECLNIKKNGIYLQALSGEVKIVSWDSFLEWFGGVLKINRPSLWKCKIYRNVSTTFSVSLSLTVLTAIFQVNLG